MTSTISLQEDFNTIISEGWRNVTYNQLKPKCEHSTTIIYRQGTRSSVTEIQIFEKLFPEHILETICMEINKNISSSTCMVNKLDQIILIRFPKNLFCICKLTLDNVFNILWSILAIQ